MLTFVIIGLWGLFMWYGFFPTAKWRFRRFPGPKPLWLIGNLPEMASLGQHAAYRHWAQKFGATFKVWMGAFPVIITEDPVAAETITKKCLYRHPVPFLETGEEAHLNDLSIVFARGDLWKSYRFAWQPMFHSGSLESFVELMRDKANRLVDILGNAAKTGEVIDMVTTFNEMTMEVVGETAYGIDFKILPQSTSTNDAKHQRRASDADLDNETRQLVTAMRAFFNGTAQMSSFAVAMLMMFPFAAPFIRWYVNTFPAPAYAALLDARRCIRDISSRMLQKARKESKDGASLQRLVNVGENNRSGVRPGSFLQLLMRSTNKVTGQSFDDIDIVANSFFFLVSANETTSTALTMAVYLLSRHPDKEAKVLEEVDRFGKGKVPTYTDINDDSKFGYLNAVIKESLRLYPPVHIATREAETDMIIDGYTVPAKTALQVSVFGMHRSPAHWKEANTFIPERFLSGTEESKGNNFKAYMPFGNGPRSCIGSGYAIQEVKVALVALYQRYTMRLVDESVKEPKLRTSITLGPEGPLMINVLLRK